MYQGKKISVAMATFNGEKFIREQLESIFNQTVLPDEIVVSDDGSKDRTLEIIQEIVKSDNGRIIKLVTDNPRHGFAFNFGHAIGRCSGDIVFLCDQDDVWLPDKVESIAKVYEEYNDALCVVHDASTIDKYGKPMDNEVSPFLRSIAVRPDTCEVIRLPGDPNCERAASAPLINGMMMSVSRELLNTAYPFPPISSQHDGWLWFCAEAQDHCYFLNKILTYRRLHEENTSGAGKQGFGRKRIRKILYNMTNHCEVARVRIMYAKYMQEYIQAHCAEENLGVKRALPTISRVWEIGQKEIAAAKRSRIVGAGKLIKLFVTDMRYRRCGTKIFLYELSDILIHSKKTRIKKLQEMQL